jgi:hypothetical protein
MRGAGGGGRMRAEGSVLVLRGWLDDVMVPSPRKPSKVRPNKDLGLDFRLRRPKVLIYLIAWL